jgi:hypothetical protein
LLAGAAQVFELLCLCCSIFLQRAEAVSQRAEQALAK